MMTLDKHPDLVSNPAVLRRGGPAKLHPILAHIFYHCTSEDMYRSMKEYVADDRVAKGYRLPLASVASKFRGRSIEYFFFWDFGGKGLGWVQEVPGLAIAFD